MYAFLYSYASWWYTGGNYISPTVKTSPIDWLQSVDGMLSVKFISRSAGESCEKSVGSDYCYLIMLIIINKVVSF